MRCGAYVVTCASLGSHCAATLLGCWFHQHARMLWPAPSRTCARNCGTLELFDGWMTLSCMCCMRQVPRRGTFVAATSPPAGRRRKLHTNAAAPLMLHEIQSICVERASACMYACACRSGTTIKPLSGGRLAAKRRESTHTRHIGIAHMRAHANTHAHNCTRSVRESRASDASLYSAHADMRLQQ